MENLDLSLIANVVQQDNKKEKRKQKRGPNKWMPMRRTVDPEVQNRIRQAVGLNDKEESPEGSAKKPTSKKKTKKSPSSAKKRIKVHDDSSEEEVMDSQKDDGASDSDNSSTNRRKSQNQKRYVQQLIINTVRTQYTPRSNICMSALAQLPAPSFSTNLTNFIRAGE